MLSNKHQCRCHFDDNLVLSFVNFIDVFLFLYNSSNFVALVFPEIAIMNKFFIILYTWVIIFSEDLYIKNIFSKRSVQLFLKFCLHGNIHRTDVLMSWQCKIELLMWEGRFIKVKSDVPECLFLSFAIAIVIEYSWRKLKLSVSGGTRDGMCDLRQLELFQFLAIQFLNECNFSEMDWWSSTWIDGR